MQTPYSRVGTPARGWRKCVTTHTQNTKHARQMVPKRMKRESELFRGISWHLVKEPGVLGSFSTALDELTGRNPGGRSIGYNIPRVQGSFKHTPRQACLAPPDCFPGWMDQWLPLPLPLKCGKITLSILISSALLITCVLCTRVQWKEEANGKKNKTKQKCRGLRKMEGLSISPRDWAMRFLSLCRERIFFMLFGRRSFKSSPISLGRSRWPWRLPQPGSCSEGWALGSVHVPLTTGPYFHIGVFVCLFVWGILVGWLVWFWFVFLFSLFCCLFGGRKQLSVRPCWYFFLKENINSWTPPGDLGRW